MIGVIGQDKLSLSEPPCSMDAFATFRVIHDDEKLCMLDIFVIPHPINIDMVSGIAHVKGNKPIGDELMIS